MPNVSFDLWTDLFLQPASSKYDLEYDIAANPKWSNIDPFEQTNKRGYNSTRTDYSSAICNDVESECSGLFMDSFDSASTDVDLSSLVMNETSKKITNVRKNDEVKGKYERLDPTDTILVDIPVDSKFFVIKSFNTTNVSLAFRHEVWSSTKKGNVRLDKEYRALTHGSRIFLLFSVNKSGRFCGIAEMISPIIEGDSRAQIWETHTSSYKFPNLFKIKWWYIKDVQVKCFNHLRWKVDSQDSPLQTLGHCRDTEQVPYSIGHLILQIFSKAQSYSSLM